VSQLRVKVVHPALAPYRIDLFNQAAKQARLDLVILNEKLYYHSDLNQQALRARLNLSPTYLSEHWSVLSRDVPYGLFHQLISGDQDVVITSEFSLSTIFVIVARLLSSRRFGHVIWTDENLATLAKHGWLRRFLRGWCAHRVDGLMMCTSEVANVFAEKFGVERWRIHLCAVHQEEKSMRTMRTASVNSAENLLRQYSLQHRRLIVFVGRLVPEKNLSVGLRAFHAIYGADVSVNWIIVGSGGERSALEALVCILGLQGRVIFVGHQEGTELYAWYRVASLLILPSTHEPYGAVVNEALACGVPVLVSNMAGASSLVEQNVNGMVMGITQSEIEDALRPASRWLVNAEALHAAHRPDLMIKHRFDESLSGFVESAKQSAFQSAMA
jgi:glycosyltransferase involved in cell wall biosynthesis